MSVRTRLAPTPSGYLHPGNGVSFVVTWALARAVGGSVLLRIDDLDRARFRIEFVEDIFRTLDWLGLDWDEGPQSPDDFVTQYSQTQRREIYEKALGQLAALGLVYACDCSRKQIRIQTADGHYPGFCRSRQINLAAPSAAWRAKLPADCITRINAWRGGKSISVDLNTAMGDFVLRQKDGIPAYQIASLCDDIHWNINFIVRGEDLVDSTAAQLWLATQLSATSFQKVTFFHHPLITGQRGEKLSKSAGATALANWRATGLSPKSLFVQAAEWLGLSVKPETAHELKEYLQRHNQAI